MSELLLEYDKNLYKNRFRLGVPSGLVEKAEKLLGDTAFREFLDYVDSGTYAHAGFAFAKSAKDNNTEITDEVRELHSKLRHVTLTGDKDLIPSWARDNVRERMLWEAHLGMLEPEKLADFEQKLKRIADTERLLVKVAERMDVSPATLELYIEEALEEIQQLLQLVS